MTRRIPPDGPETAANFRWRSVAAAVRRLARVVKGMDWKPMMISRADSSCRRRHVCKVIALGLGTECLLPSFPMQQVVVVASLCIQWRQKKSVCQYRIQVTDKSGKGG